MSGETNDWPNVSVILPVAEDPDGITTTLDSVLASTYPADRLEVLVIVDGEAERTRSIVREYDETHEPVTLLVEDEFHTPGAARNIGIRSASGEILLFVDADMRVPASWIEHTVVAFQATDAACMGLDVELSSLDHTRSVLEAFDRLESFRIELLVEKLNFAPTCSLVTTKALFDDVGYFDPRLVSHEDHDLGRRAVAARYETVYCNDVAGQIPNCTAPTLVHPPRETVRARLRRRWKMGRGTSQTTLYYDRTDSFGSLLKHRLRKVREPPNLKNRPERWQSLSRVERVGLRILQLLLHVSWILGAIYQYVLESTLWGQAELRTDNEAAEIDAEVGHSSDSH